MARVVWDAVQPRVERSAPVVFLLVALLGLATWRAPSITPLFWSSALLVAAVAVGFARVRATTKETAVGCGIIAVAALVTLLGKYNPAPAFELLYSNLTNVRFLLLGWALVLWSPWANRMDGSEPRGVSLARHLAVLVAGAGVLFLADWSLTPDGHTGFTDEVLYVFQSSLFASGKLRAPLPDELRPFLSIISSVMSPNEIHAQYPPGWPALLAGLETAGLFLFPWIFPALSLIGVWKCARHLGGPAAGTLAVVVLLVNVHFIRWSVGYLSHGAAGCCLIWGTALGLDAESKDGARRWTCLVAAGLLAGVAVAIRPLTGLALGAAVWIWLCVRTRSTGRSWLAMSGALAAGALVPCLAFLWFNAATNESPLTLGYNAAHQGHWLGFAVTFNPYDQFGQPFAVTRARTPWHAVQRCLALVAALLKSSLPFAAAAPLAWMGWRAGLKIRPIALAFLLLPLAYVFWPVVTIRQMSELFLFVALGLGLVLGKLLEQRRIWTRWTVAALVAAGLVVTSAQLAPHRALSRRWSPYVARVNELAAAGPMLIFVNRGTLTNEEALYEKLWWFNARDWMGKVVVARDLGARNKELIARFPHHAAYLVSWREGVTTTADVPISAICGLRAQRGCANVASPP